jgi:hypothetical protein
VDLNPESENCSVQKRPTYQNDFGNSDQCKRKYRQYRTWVEAGKWGGCHSDRTASFGVAGLGERRSLAGTTSTPPSTTYVPSVHFGRNPAPLELHYFPSRSSPTQTQRKALLRCSRKQTRSCKQTRASTARASRPAFVLVKSVTGSNAALAGRGCVRSVPREHMS